MNPFFTTAVIWLDDRTGLPSTIKHFLLEDIPESAGWPQVFGSVALFLFGLQAFTGVLLAMNYAATPDDAYKSLVYVIRSVAAGRMIRGLHHWGASLMVIVVFLHMAQVFIYGAYRKPREATWMAGVCLLLFVLAFGLTGYLLPWDNRAYWGTIVTTRIIGSLPLLGAFLSRVIGFSKGIGVLTFSRFYAAHAMLLPTATLFLIAIHVALVRKHGVMPDEPQIPITQKFYPRQAARDVVAVFIVFLILFAATIFVDAPLERIADATDTNYQPRPEWYFLFLFELLKFLPGSLELLGTVILPSLAVLTLFALPFFPFPRFSPSKLRGISAAIVLLVFGVWGSLTLAAARSDSGNKQADFGSSPTAEWASIPAEQIAGLGYFKASGCASCHNLVSGPPKEGLNLGLSATSHSKEWLVKHFGDEHGANLSLPQLNALAAFVENAHAESIEIFQSIPSPAIRGAQVYVSGACATCHKVNRSGGSLGPSLNGLRSRREKEWVTEHFLAPRRLSPGSNMPAYHFANEEREAIISYLFALPN